MKIIKKLINRVLDRSVSMAQLVVLGIVVIATISYALAWNPPSGNPPTGNADAPLNVGLAGQMKSGGLLVGAGPGTTTGLIVQNGNVGIGTINPQSKLVIMGDTVDTDRILIGSVNPLNLGELRPDFGNLRMIEAPSGLALRSSGSGFPHMVILNNGNVGIGTSPQEKLHVYGHFMMENYDNTGHSRCDFVTQALIYAPGWAIIAENSGKYLCMRCDG